MEKTKLKNVIDSATKIWQVVQEKGKKFHLQFSHRIAGKYYIFAQLISDIFAGFSLVPFLLAIVLHITSFAFLNWYLYHSIIQSYQQYQVNPKNDFSIWENNKNIIRWQIGELRTWLTQEVEGFSENENMNADQLISSMFSTIKSPASEEKNRKEALETMITGNIRGMNIFWLKVDIYSAEKIFDELASIGDWKKIFEGKDTEKSNDTENKRNFMIHCIRLAQNKTSGEIRLLKRFSDSIQYIIFLISWVLFCHLVQRYFRIKPDCPKEDFLGSISSEFKLSSVLTWEKARELVENRIYYPYQFFLGAISSLGFIGTVMGMGQALLKADRLFSAQNIQERQLAVSQITQELGFAFDTTFVALLSGIFIGLIFLACHRKEMKIFIESSQS